MLFTKGLPRADVRSRRTSLDILIALFFFVERNDNDKVMPKTLRVNLQMGDKSVLRSFNFHPRTVLTFVTAHTLCASRDTGIILRGLKLCEESRT